MAKNKKGSISLIGAISLGTGVMIGAGIFALLGQVAEKFGRIGYAELVNSVPRSSTPKTRVQGSTLRFNTIYLVLLRPS